MENEKIKNTNKDENEEIKKLLKENLRLNKEMHAMIKKVNHFIVWQRVYGYLKVFIFVIPLILGWIYLQPILNNALGQYQELLGVTQDLNTVTNPATIGSNLLKNLPSGAASLLK